MNFNFNNQRAKFNFAPPIMRHFSTIGLVSTKPEPTECLHTFKSNIFSTFQDKVMPNKIFSNPNFVNKQNPSILTPSVAGALKLTNFRENIKPNLYTQQPKHDNYSKKQPEENTTVYQPTTVGLSSQNCPETTGNKLESPVLSTKIECTSSSPKPCKKTRNRNRKSRKNAKRQKQEFIASETSSEQKFNMTAKRNIKINCSSPKKIKKEPKSKKTKKSKPWHKISFNKEIMECDETFLMTPDPDVMEAPKEGFCFQIKSAPIEISPKCSGAFSFSISPCTEFFKNLSSSNSSSEVLSCSPSSPAIRRLRKPSECDSEDSFIVFCDDGNDCCSEEVTDDSDFDEEESDSDFDVVDFKEKTDLNRTPAKKKVSFACDETLCKVHPMVQWGYAYQAARRGPWEELARDRFRFETRISNTGNVLNKILDPDHRARIYQDRFQEK